MSDRIDKLKQLHDADPADADVPYMIALEVAKTDDLPAALAWLDKAIATDADHFYAYYQKGRILGELGQPAPAAQAIEAGLARAQAAGDGKAASELQELRASLG